MFLFLGITSLAAELIAIDETIGLFAVALVMVAAAVGLRSLISRKEKAKTNTNTASLAGKQNG